MTCGALCWYQSLMRSHASSCSEMEEKDERRMKIELNHLSCKDRCISMYDCVVENSLLCKYDSILLSLPTLAPASTMSRIYHIHCSRREPVFLLVLTLLVHSTPAFCIQQSTICGGVVSL